MKDGLKINLELLPRLRLKLEDLNIEILEQRLQNCGVDMKRIKRFEGYFYQEEHLPLEAIEQLIMKLLTILLFCLEEGLLIVDEVNFFIDSGDQVPKEEMVETVKRRIEENLSVSVQLKMNQLKTNKA